MSVKEIISSLPELTIIIPTSIFELIVYYGAGLYGCFHFIYRNLIGKKF